MSAHNAQFKTGAASSPSSPHRFISETAGDAPSPRCEWVPALRSRGGEGGRCGFLFSGEERASDQFGSWKGKGKTRAFTHYERRRTMFWGLAFICLYLCFIGAHLWLIVRFAKTSGYADVSAFPLFAFRFFICVSFVPICGSKRFVDFCSTISKIGATMAK
jgi:hypothetical protein